MSTNGRYVAFESWANNIVPDDANRLCDVFVYDRQTGQTTRVSVDSSGAEGNASSFAATISADGRHVGFISDATNLVPGDTNGTTDVFVHDRRTGQTTRVSLGSAGNEGNNASRSPSISGDGGHVLFVSMADNFVPDDTNECADVFLHDRKTGRTTRVSVDSGGTQADAGSGEPALSADGRYAAFYSHAMNLVPADINGKPDVFLRDLGSSKTTRVSVDSQGTEGNADSRMPAISGNGRHIAFESWASNLVPDDTNGRMDTFLHDRRTGKTERVSLDSAGRQSPGDSRNASLSPDARYVLFTGFANHLVPEDTNKRADVYVRDLRTDELTRVSVSSDGEQGNHDSDQSSISSDGRYVAFSTKAKNLLPNDKNRAVDVVIHDCKTGKLTRASIGCREP
jgi:Tol biopolymer transport system component